MNKEAKSVDFIFPTSQKWQFFEQDSHLFRCNLDTGQVWVLKYLQDKKVWDEVKEGV